MSQLVRLEGKHSTQNAHCALLPAGFRNNDQKSILKNGAHNLQG